VGDMPVEIEDYDPAWRDGYAVQRDRLSMTLQQWLARPVEHVGSTSVPGLPAKPVVDILAPVGSLIEAQEAIGGLEADGWLHWSEDPLRSWRLWFLRPRPAVRTHHLHVVQHDDPHVRELLAFRDSLRADDALREEYTTLKRQLANDFRDNRNAYSNAKSEFVERVLRAAGLRLQPRQRLPEE
jgi:GrpB-like predicted nucleotidyltransferase (UPF0157 family)